MLFPWSYGTNLTVNYSPRTETQGLREIGTKFCTDKITHHHYDFYYTRYIEKFRNIRFGAMLEIGIDRGASLLTWLNYFPYAFIYGLDIGVTDEGQRHKIFKADQSDVASLSAIAETGIKHPIFLIIDDGSHVPEHQATSFDFLFKNLLIPGGVYIIEDIEVSYWTKGGLYGYQTNYGYYHPLSIIEVFKKIADDINCEFLTAKNRELQEEAVSGMISKDSRSLVSSVTFCKNCIVIIKKTEDELRYDNRTYRLSANL